MVSLSARLAVSDWFHPLPLVLLGLQSVLMKICQYPPLKLFLVLRWFSLVSSQIALSSLLQNISAKSNKSSRIIQFFRPIRVQLRQIQFKHQLRQVCSELPMCLLDRIKPNLHFLHSTEVLTQQSLILQSIFLSRLIPSRIVNYF